MSGTLAIPAAYLLASGSADEGQQQPFGAIGDAAREPLIGVDTCTFLLSRIHGHSPAPKASHRLLYGLRT